MSRESSGPAGRQYHIGLAPGELGQGVILVGDPERATLGAGLLDAVELERRHREYLTYTGRHRGLRLSIMATGMGPDNMEIAVIELSRAGERPALVRCGSSGALDPSLALGELVISQAAYRLESTSLQFVGEGYPAAAHPELLLALVQAAEHKAHPYRVGITATAPGFYGAQARHVEGFPPRDPALLDDLRRQGVLNLEMEISCLYSLASLAGLRAAAVCAIFTNRCHADRFIEPAQRQAAERACLEVGLEALHNLDRLDQERGSRPLWHPGLRNDAK